MHEEEENEMILSSCKFVASVTNTSSSGTAALSLEGGGIAHLALKFTLKHDK